MNSVPGLDDPKPALLEIDSRRGLPHYSFCCGRAFPGLIRRLNIFFWHCKPLLTVILRSSEVARGSPKATATEESHGARDRLREAIVSTSPRRVAFGDPPGDCHVAELVLSGARFFTPLRMTEGAKGSSQ